MRTRLRRDLTSAIKARDAVAVAALRSALAAIENAEALPAGDRPGGPKDTRSEHMAGSAHGLGKAEVEPRNLTDADLRTILETEIRERSLAARQYEQAGGGDRAEHLRAEADHLCQYLPRAR
jgi:hypothetical protein